MRSTYIIYTGRTMALNEPEQLSSFLRSFCCILQRDLLELLPVRSHTRIALSHKANKILRWE